MPKKNEPRCLTMYEMSEVLRNVVVLGVLLLLAREVQLVHKQSSVLLLFYAELRFTPYFQGGQAGGVGSQVSTMIFPTSDAPYNYTTNTHLFRLRAKTPLQPGITGLRSVLLELCRNHRVFRD